MAALPSMSSGQPAFVASAWHAAAEGQPSPVASALSAHSKAQNVSTPTSVMTASAAVAAVAGVLRPRRSQRKAERGSGARGQRVVAMANAGAKAGSTVALLGDSVLDNFIWLQTPERHLRVQLEEMLQKQDSKTLPKQVVSLAVDQTSTFDFEERSQEKNSWAIFADARRKVSFADESDKEYGGIDGDGVLRQPKALEGISDVSWAILSVGGNDVYLNAPVQANLVTSLLPGQEGLRNEVAAAFGKRLRGNVEAIKRSAPNANLVLVIPYHPHRQFSLLVGAPIDADGNEVKGDLLGDVFRGLEFGTLSDLVTPLVRQILALARELKIPVIDLSKTFDVEVVEHYGTGRIGSKNSLNVPWSGAEPSDVSSDFIAQLIAHAVSREPEAVVYRGVSQRVAVGSGNAWSLNIRQDVNDFLYGKNYRFGPVIEKTAEERENKIASAATGAVDAVGSLDSGSWFVVGGVIALVGNVAVLLGWIKI